MSASTLSPSFFSSSRTSSSSHFESIEPPEAMRFSTRARLRPTFCAFSGSSQKPGADISRSISSSDLRAEATSKIAPDGAQSGAEVVDACGRVVSHMSECKMQNAKCKIASGSFCILHFEFCIRRQANDNRRDSKPRKPVSVSHIRRPGVSRRKLRQQNPFVPHRYFMHHPAGGVDPGGNAGGGGAEKPAVVLDGAEARLVEVLPRGGRSVVPGVVRDRHQHVGAVADLRARDLRIDDLVADRRSVRVLPAPRTVVPGELE